MKYNIGVDVDSVLRNFPLDLVRVIRREHPEWYNEKYPVPDQWEMDKCFHATTDEINQIYWHDHTAEIMGNGTPIKENVDYLKKILKDSEHNFVCITSQRPHARFHTLNWLGKQELNFETVYFKKSAEKWLVEVDFLIDDSPNVYNYWRRGRSSDESFILIDRPHNQKCRATHRVANIEEGMRIINGKG